MPCDYSKYPPNWFTEIRPRILARAGNCCEHPGCRLEHGKTAISFKMFRHDRAMWFREGTAMPDNSFQQKPVKVILIIAHLDHDPENWQVKDERLRALCQLHHLRHDSKMKADKR